MSEITPNEELDCRGLNCPLPVLRTKKALKPMTGGDVLKVVSTDPGSVADMGAFSRRTGNELLDSSQGDGEFTFFFKKKA
jgi:tRNA 2-thiouridine synthesizing protein A